MNLDFNKLRAILEIQGDPVIANGMKKYMRNQFDYFGIPSPKRKLLVKDFVSSYKLTNRDNFLEFIEMCWLQPQREFKYVAMDLSLRQLKFMNRDYIQFFEKLIAMDSWWDTVDCLAPQILGKIILKDLDLRLIYCEKWIESENFWYQRAAIISQLMYRHQTDFLLLQALILRRADSKEFFIRKASGWALRQYSKINPGAVKEFISTNSLSPLTVREGMRRINN